jgi:hypothetical protein
LRRAATDKFALILAITRIEVFNGATGSTFTVV